MRDDFCIFSFKASIFSTKSKLESYLVNKRADTLKEALNLFEEEKRHDEQMREINIVQQMQEITYKKADEAATLGWVNLIFKK